MSYTNNGGPAFPIPLNNGESWTTMGPCDGMSLRDYMAIHASETDILHQTEEIRSEMRRAGVVDALPDGWIVTARYMHADAMLKAREGGAS